MTKKEIDQYLTIKIPAEGTYKEKGSKFLAFAYPVFDEEDVKELLKKAKKKYYDARHHVYAFRLGADLKNYRYSDDGEPSNSSGPPVMGQIRTYGLTNILIIVVRYFGGIKLGVSGLINAYKSAAGDAIENANIIKRFEEDIFTINFTYAEMNTVMKILKEENPNRLSQDFGNNCSIKLSIRKKLSKGLKNKLLKINNLDII